MRKAGFFLWLSILVAFLSGCQGQPAIEKTSTTVPPKVVIYLFWGDGCPHCALAKPFLMDLAQRYPSTELRPYEVWYVAENQDLFKKMTEVFGFEPSAVPTIFIGDQYWEGYNDQVAQEIETAVQNCEQNGCPDRGTGIIPGL